MNEFASMRIAVGFLTALSTQPVGARGDSTTDRTLRFVAEFHAGANGDEGASTLDVTFYGARPDPAQAEETLRNCIKAAVATHPGSDIEGKVWHGKTPGDRERQTVELTSGVSLLYVAADEAIRSNGGGDAPSAANAEEAGDDLSWITEDPEVIGACEGSQQEQVAILVGVAAEHRGRDRALIVKAMRALCKEDNVTLDRKLRVCMSAISKVVVAAKSAPMAAALPEDLPAAIARGKSAYAIGQCDKCHLASGRGGKFAPDLTDDKWLHCDGDIQSIRKVLVSGVPTNKLSDRNRPFGMNPATDLIPDGQQLTDLAIYVHSLSQN